MGSMRGARRGRSSRSGTASPGESVQNLRIRAQQRRRGVQCTRSGRFGMSAARAGYLCADGCAVRAGIGEDLRHNNALELAGRGPPGDAHRSELL